MATPQIINQLDLVVKLLKSGASNTQNKLITMQYYEKNKYKQHQNHTAHTDLHGLQGCLRAIQRNGSIVAN